MSHARNGYFTQLIQTIRRSWKVKRHIDTAPKICVGTDEHGNQYFEQKGSEDGTIKDRRWVQALIDDQTVPPRVPIHWDAWLRGRRNEAPTEVEADAIEQRLALGRRKDMTSSAKSEDNIFEDPDAKVPFPKYNDMKPKPFGRHSPD